MSGARAPADGRELGRRLRDRDLTAAPAALNLIESRAPDAREQAEALLAALSPAALGHEAPAHVIGVTGPPGVGKSSLLSQLVKHWRACDRSVAVLAVDPSSRRSGGSLLGDRARIEADPKDRHVFIRSTAAGTRLGGLAPATRAASEALAAAFDVVVIETVGVGQSETEVADAADTVAVVLQPASGDVLQFLKAGIMEVPDVLVLTKTDLGAAATRAMSDLQAALLALGATGTEVCPVSSVPPPRASRSWRKLWKPTAHASTSRNADSAPAGAMRSRTSPSSTVSGGSARSGDASRPSAGSRRRIRRSTCPRSSGPWPTARGASSDSGPGMRGIRRRQGVARRIVLPAEPLIDGPTALRAWRDSDLQPLVTACQDPEISRWTRVPFPYGPSDARNYLLQRHDALHAGASAPFAIVLAEDRDHLLGSISLMRFSWKNARGEVGYWLAQDARGQGHTTRAVRLITNWGFVHLGLQRIDLMAATGNPASQRVAERCGFTREAVLRSFMVSKNGRDDMVAFGLLATDVRD